MDSVDEILDLQAGVVARRQLIARGWTNHEIARMLRKRLWARVLEGIYVNHTGEPTLDPGGLGRRALLLAGRLEP